MYLSACPICARTSIHPQAERTAGSASLDQPDARCGRAGRIETSAMPLNHTLAPARLVLSLRQPLCLPRRITLSSLGFDGTPFLIGRPLDTRCQEAWRAGARQLPLRRPRCRQADCRPVGQVRWHELHWRRRFLLSPDIACRRYAFLVLTIQVLFFFPVSARSRCPAAS